MFDFLNRGRAKTDRPDPVAPAQPPAAQTTTTQRDMARLTLRQILKHHGIPVHWIAGEVVPIHIPSKGNALLLQLEIMHWHDALVLHAPALQQELLDGMRRFDPPNNGTHYLFAWKFSAECGCPYTQLPGPGFWSSAPSATPAQPVALTPAPAATVAPLGPLAPSQIPFDLSNLHDDDDDQGFAPTQMRGLHD